MANLGIVQGAWIEQETQLTSVQLNEEQILRTHHHNLLLLLHLQRFQFRLLRNPFLKQQDLHATLRTHLLPYLMQQNKDAFLI